jgi:hypothetical protein
VDRGALATPERLERGIEHREVVVVGTKSAAQRPVDVVVRGGVDRGQREHSVPQAARAHFEVGRPEDAAEADEAN